MPPWYSNDAARAKIRDIIGRPNVDPPPRTAQGASKRYLPSQVDLCEVATFVADAIDAAADNASSGEDLPLLPHATIVHGIIPASDLGQYSEFSKDSAQMLKLCDDILQSGDFRSMAHANDFDRMTARDWKNQGTASRVKHYMEALLDNPRRLPPMGRSSVAMVLKHLQNTALNLRDICDAWCTGRVAMRRYKAAVETFKGNAEDLIDMMCSRFFIHAVDDREPGKQFCIGITRNTVCCANWCCCVK